MKRCPQCNRTYTDDALSFCLDDGSPLTIASGPPPSDASTTVQYPPARDTTPQPTIAYNPGQAAPPPLMPPPAWSPMPPPQTQKRSVWPWLLGIGAVLVLSAMGFLIYSYLTAQRRMLEFAVLRTMGFSRRQITTLVGFEQLPLAFLELVLQQR